MRRRSKMFIWYQVKCAFFGAFTLLSTVILCEIAYYRFMPATHWFEYYSIVPYNKVVEPNLSLLLEIDRVIHRPVYMQFNHSLVCNVGFPAYTYISTSTHGRMISNPHKGRESGILRVYRGNRPNITTECYTDSVIKALLPWGLSKEQQVIGPMFTSEAIPPKF